MNVQNNERKPLTVETIRTLWSQTYNTRGKPDWSHLYPYYHEDLVFQDAIQRIEGKSEFIRMCDRLAKRCKELRMDLATVTRDETGAFLEWKMTMMFRIFPSTPMYGCSRLTIDEDGLITSQRDYYDLWGDINYNIPGYRRLYRAFMHKFFG
ncbi:MAG: nuclear transport factor 2 family protein [Sphaerochaetaceae bacterium]|nr:nuclear transport factor 2 family protein [Sphaerochaetaceae bacterium]